MVAVRAATVDDARAIAEIYAHHVLTGTGTFDEVPPTADYFAARIAEVTGRGWPWLVALQNGLVDGYAYAAQFRDRPGYRYTCEDSIYVSAPAAGQGIGSALLERLLDDAATVDFRMMIAVIGDAANLASIKLHERHGFTHAGTIHDAGIKFGRCIDVVTMQRALKPIR